MRLLRTLSYMARIISVTMAATLLLLSAPHVFAIEDPPVFFYNEAYPMNEKYWQIESGTQGYHGIPVTSKENMLGIKWELYGLAYNYPDNGNRDCIYNLLGGAGVATKPYLKTIDKVAMPVSGLAVICSVDNRDYWANVKSISLTVSPNKDMSDGITNEATIPTDFVNDYVVVLDVSNPCPDMYYRINLSLDKINNKTGWFYLKELRFALPESTKDLPDFSYVDNPASGKYTVNLSASEGRELHVMWGKYNSLNEPLGNCFEENSSLMSGPERAADIIKDPSKAWANKVESPYSKTFDVSSPFGEYYVLRAKTRRNGYPTDQSNEIIKVISKSGIVTGIDSIVDDSNVQPGGEEQWFNMQGVRISRPETPGIYVRVRDGKSGKIML